MRKDRKNAHRSVARTRLPGCRVGPPATGAFGATCYALCREGGCYGPDTSFSRYTGEHPPVSVREAKAADLNPVATAAAMSRVRSAEGLSTPANRVQ